MPHDGKCALREHIKRESAILPLHGAANGGSKVQLDTAADSRGWRASQLVSRQYAVYWLAWLLLCACFAIRHTTKLLDAAGQQHFLLAPPTPDGTHMATAAATGKPLVQHTGGSASSHSSSSTANVTRTSGDDSSRVNAWAAGVLADQHSKWPDGYVAVCAVIKDQWPDLRYWIEYHRWLGVTKFYIYDNNSTLPAMLMLWDYMQEGIVEYQYFLGRPRSRPDFTDTNQYRAYQGCLLQHFRRHRWIAFIDADEFFVFLQHSNSSRTSIGNSSDTDGRTVQDHPQIDHFDLVSDNHTAAAPPALHTTLVGHTAANSTAIGSISTVARVDNLAVFLSQYEGQAAIGVNWVLFGSNGHLTRPAEGPLAAFTTCVPHSHWESTHVKVIANTNGILGMGGTPHEVLARPGRSVVDIDQVPFKGPKTHVAKWHKLVLHHYVLKSKAEFVAKKTRGSGAGNKKDWGYWQYIEQLANETCTDGIPVSKAFMSSQPRLGLPQAAHVLQGCHQKAAAAYEALLQGAGGEQPENKGGDAPTPTTGTLGDSPDLLPC